jgi:hypothetical protein
MAARAAAVLLIGLGSQRQVICDTLPEKLRAAHLPGQSGPTLPICLGPSRAISGGREPPRSRPLVPPRADLNGPSAHDRSEP